MRRFDKNKNIKKANLLAEQRYLESKGIIKENIEEEYYDSRKEVENYVDAEEIKGKHLWFHTNRTHKNNGWNGMIGIYQSSPNGRKTGSPIAYTNEVRLTGPIYFQTSEIGSNKIKQTGHRVLIAGVSGVVTDTRPGDTSGMELATYNPFEAGVFHLVNDSDEKEIVSADEVYFHASEDGKWSFYVKGPKFANEDQLVPTEQPGEEAIAEGETAPYDRNIPMRPLSKEETGEIIKWAEDFKNKNRYFDPYQDFAFDYISGTKHHRISTVANLDSKSENSLWGVKIPEDAWPGKIIGNMNYTDAYKEGEAQKQRSGLHEDDGVADDFGLMANLIVTRIGSKEVDSQEFYDYLINNKEEVLNFVRGLDAEVPENPYLRILMLNPKESLKFLNV